MLNITELTYASYHQHPVNKAIHFVCIPMIVLTSMNFLDEVKLFKIFGKFFTLTDIGRIVYDHHYLQYSWKTSTTMFIYMFLLNMLSLYWKKKDKNWASNSRKIFIAGWLLQFLGHYIEGRRPRLVDSLPSAVFEAPMFPIQYLTN
jgi:uncharacterized membrane protein YGL010W